MIQFILDTFTCILRGAFTKEMKDNSSKNERQSYMKIKYDLNEHHNNIYINKHPRLTIWHHLIK